MEYLEGTLLLKKALVKKGMDLTLELRDPKDKIDDATDIIKLPDDLYLLVGIYHPETPQKYSVFLNESMPFGGNPTLNTWDMRTDCKDSINAIVDSVTETK